MKKTLFSVVVLACLLVRADVVVENARFRLTLGDDACAKSLVVKATGEECLAKGSRVPFLTSTQERPFNNEIKLIHPNRRTTYAANRLRREGKELIVGFETAPYEAVVKVGVTDDALTFTLDRFITDTVQEKQYLGLWMDVPPVAEFRLCQLAVAPRRHFGEWLNVAWDERAAVAVVGTDPYAEIGFDIGEGRRVLHADLYRGIRVKGGSAAIVAGAGKDDFLAAMRAFEERLDLPRGVASRQSDYINQGMFWSNEITPRNVDESIAFLKRMGLRLVCLCFTSIVKDSTASIGDYVWREEYPNGAEDLKAMIAKFNAAGIRVGLHTLQTHIGLDCAYVTPKADSRLNLIRRFSLARPVSERESPDVLFVEQDPRECPLHDRCRVLQFGGELFTYEGYSSERPYRFTGVKRGYKGTAGEAHPKGQSGGILDISEYGGVSCYIDQDTDLQEEIADKIAVLYDCGMDFCYLDGSEGVNPPCGINVSLSQYRVVKRFRRMPLFTEGAAKTHFGWHLQAGGNAFDPFSPEEFKRKIVEYPLAEAAIMADNFTRIDFGWWCIPPGSNTWTVGRGVSEAPSIGTQPDMWEFGTSKAAAWDCPVMFFISEEARRKTPRVDDIVEVMRRWEDVRAKGWLTARQKELLKDPSREFHLYVNERNEYELREIEMLPSPAAAPHLRGFVFERNGRCVVARWHMSGTGTLEWPLGATASVSKLEYVETDLSRAEVRKAWMAARMRE